MPRTARARRPSPVLDMTTQHGGHVSYADPLKLHYSWVSRARLG